MTPKPPRVIFAALLAGSFTISSGLPAKDSPRVFAGLTLHEWGTFTSIAGRGGQAVEWSPLTGSTDLPGFVEHFRDGNFKVGLRGTVRMETPVLYFYDSREENVSVKVSFSQGVITEWYPHATRVDLLPVSSTGACTTRIPMEASRGTRSPFRRGYAPNSRMRHRAAATTRRDRLPRLRFA